jgi:hypothetical protein
MGTGIVAVALRSDGREVAADALLGVAIATAALLAIARAATARADPPRLARERVGHLR